MLKNRFLNISTLYFAFVLSFIFIQPFKILAAISGIGLLKAQFLIPLLPYLAYLINAKEYSQIKIHLKTAIVQLIICSIHFFVAKIFFNNYLIFFLVTPHYFLFAKYLFEKYPNPKWFINILSSYITIISVLSVVSMLKYPVPINLLSYFSALGLDFVTRSDTLTRWHIIESINFSKILFGTDPLVLEGVALTVYPLVLIGMIFINFDLIKNKLTLLGLMSSLFLILSKSSRGEIIYLFLLAGYPVAQKLFSKAKWLSLSILGLGFIQLFLGNKTLNGRHILNNLFLNSISYGGNGIGYSSDKIKLLTNGDYSSFHNIHFEIITNFGILLYLGFLSYTVFFVMKGPYDRIKHLYLCLFFFLFTTNFELFDLYFYIPLAFAFSRKPEPELPEVTEKKTQTFFLGVMKR